VSRDNQPPPISRDNQPPPMSRDNQPPPVSRDNQPPPLSRDNQPPPLSRDNQPPPVSRDNQPDIPISKLDSIAVQERLKYARIFQREDPNNTKYISGEIAFQLFMRSKLPQDDLALIWELSDQDKDGQLNIDEFTVSMYLINTKLRGEVQSIPPTLPSNLKISNYSQQEQNNTQSQVSIQGQVNMQDQMGDTMKNLETQAQQYVGKQVGNMATNRDNQKVVGEMVANNSSNPVVSTLARNKHVQEGVGKGVSIASNDPRVQQKATSSAKSFVKNQFI
jgi:hypothetical protein